MREFRFLVVLIVILEVSLFLCGLKVVSNRHQARGLFIQLEREQQIHHALMDERSQLKLEISNLEKTIKIQSIATRNGLIPVDPNQTIILKNKVAMPNLRGNEKGKDK